MLVAYEGKQYLIQWKHNPKPKSKKEKKCTTCSLELVEFNGKEPTAIWGYNETVCCSREDNYCKDTGRKLSLTQLLLRQTEGDNPQPIFPKAMRKVIWHTYFESRGFLLSKRSHGNAVTWIKNKGDVPMRQPTLTEALHAAV